MIGIWALLGALVVTGAVGAVLRFREGRVTKVAARDVPDEVRELLAPDAVTLVQLSTTFCAPCRHAKVLLGDLASRTEGLHHVELDITNLPAVASTLGVLRTPTTVAYSAAGTELLRVGGVPRRDALLDALRPHLVSPT
ncbi:thiol reductase thioredoxin [Lentzea sp. NBRC 105346]|uniref:thioredoxin family protein n=1 Tax=Lentzea sp. NBRC 105346 TaxID=3032205 RepID=UPI0024A1CC7A|nr:thioredoxin family protein [Lentzea sp. NBRC 105346]GLZ31446.1 thiol reductase thioredoxin [Lentzea sp. NBRC 105346]